MGVNEMMDECRHEAEVASIEYVGPHVTKPNRFEVTLTLEAGVGAGSTRLCLVFRATEATFLADMLRANPPQIGTEDHLMPNMAHLTT